jgi:hypothetical protein
MYRKSTRESRHFALLCPDIMASNERLEAACIGLSGGRVRFGREAQRIIVRDPDRNVIDHPLGPEGEYCV